MVDKLITKFYGLSNSKSHHKFRPSTPIPVYVPRTKIYSQRTFFLNTPNTL